MSYGPNYVDLTNTQTITGVKTFSNTPIFTNVPTTSTEGANKGYVDSVAGAGLSVQTACVVGSTADLGATYINGAAGIGATLTNAGAQAAFSIDGISPSLNDRILVKDQTSTLQNGIYTLTTVGSGLSNWVLTRATDNDQITELKAGNLVLVNSGTVNANTSWLETATITAIGTDPIIYTQFTSNPATFLKVSSNLSDVGNKTTSRSNLGVAIGSDVQAYNANLTTWAGKTVPTGTVVGTTDSQTLTNKKLVDASTTFVDDGDNTKQLAIQCSGISASTTRTWTSQDANGTVAYLADIPSVSPAALTKTDDTNVTLTLGGTPATALLQAASLTLGWTGTLGVARGGTNIASYAVGDLLYASGATTLSKLADVATGQVLVSGGVTTAPAYSATPTVTTLTGSTSLLTPLLDTASSGTLAIGTTTATAITLAQTTTLAANKSLSMSAGTGGLSLGSGTGDTALPTGSGSWSGAAGKNWSFTEGAASSGTSTGLTWTGGAHTGLTASTEVIGVNFNLAQTVQHATGALATQRAFVVQAPTYSFAGTSTLTKAATFAITGAPATGTNATITNAYSLWVQAGKAQFDGALTVANGQTATLPGTTNGPGGGSTWTLNNPSSGAIDLQSAGVSYWLINDSGNPNAIALGSGKSITGIAGAGGFNFGAMTGDWSMPTGSASWTGASTKTLTFATSSGSNLTMGSNVTLSASGQLTLSGNSLVIQNSGTTIATTGTSGLTMGTSKSLFLAKDWGIGDGTVSQATNINTGVTCNFGSGVITTQTATTAARTAETGFTVTNSKCGASSIVIAQVIAYSGTLFTNGQPDVYVSAVASGSFNISVINRDATNALNGTMLIHYCVL